MSINEFYKNSKKNLDIDFLQIYSIKIKFLRFFLKQKLVVLKKLLYKRYYSQKKMSCKNKSYKSENL